MARNMLVKLTLMVFVVGSFFSLIMVLSSKHEEAVAHDLAGSWLGETSI